MAKDTDAALYWLAFALKKTREVSRRGTEPWSYDDHTYPDSQWKDDAKHYGESKLANQTLGNRQRVASVNR
jgi:hypothetical protein